MSRLRVVVLLATGNRSWITVAYGGGTIVTVPSERHGSHGRSRATGRPGRPDGRQGLPPCDALGKSDSDFRVEVRTGALAGAGSLVTRTGCSSWTPRDPPGQQRLPPR
jgi:hypothetical protein